MMGCGLILLDKIRSYNGLLQGRVPWTHKDVLVSAVNKKIKQLKALNEKYLSLLEENAALKAELESLRQRLLLQRKPTAKRLSLMIQIPDTLVMFFVAIGLMHLGVYVVALARYLLHYLKFKSLPRQSEETILLLRSGRDQDRKIQNLEKETEKMTMALLKHLSWKIILHTFVTLRSDDDYRV